MSDEQASGSGGWKARLRHWLWLDKSAMRNSRSEANRSLYPGGPQMYSGQKPVGLRFLVSVVLLGLVIALVIIVV